MSGNAITLECDNCRTINESDAKFCKKCGNTLLYKTQNCKKCGITNDVEAVYCKNCGVNLREATIGITSTKAKEWWDLLNTFEFYKKLWYQGGAGNSLHNQCKQIRDNYFPNIQWEMAVFSIPISSIDWCIRSLFIGKTEITNGEFLCTTSELIIFDIKSRNIRVFPYSQIAKVNLNKLQQGLTLQIHLSDNSIIYAFLKENAPTELYVRGVLDIAGALINGLVSEKEESDYDKEVRDKNDEAARRRYAHNYEVGQNFWKNIVAFFNEILIRTKI